MKHYLLTFLCILFALSLAAENDYYANIDKARNGNKNAQYNIGYFYFYGKGGVSQNYDIALPWLRKAADQGVEQAQALLGLAYDHGFGVPQDYATAAYWYRKAADKGDVLALNNLGLLYDEGNGVEKNLYKAAELYKKAADKGDDIAQYNIANCYAKGQGVAENDDLAFSYYKKSAEQGYANAQYELGRCYDLGNGTYKSDYQALIWYRKAAEQNHGKAQYQVANAYLYGSGVTKDVGQAIIWYRKAIPLLEAEAEAEEEKDTWKMSSLYVRLAKMDLYSAGYELGMDYYNGTGGQTRNYSTAFAWFKDAALHDNENAMYMTGKCYALGHGVGRDKTKAVQWYKQAAKERNKEAMYELGLCYKNGDGVAKDEEESIDWLVKAARDGHVDAMYEVGLSCEKSEIYDNAAEWYLEMLEKGDAAQKAKAEKRLQALSDDYDNSFFGNKGSRKAFQYIHQGSLALKANNKDEKIYTKAIAKDDYTYRATGEWNARSLPVGSYYVKRVRDNWEDKYDTIHIIHPATNITLPPMLPKTGTLVVKSRPKNANVYIDGVQRGTTPWRGELQIGEHNVWVSKQGRISSATEHINIPYKNTAYTDFKLKSEWYYGSDYHPDHYLEPMYGIEFAEYNRHHYAGVRYGWIPKRFGLDVTALYGITNQELSATIGPTFRLTSFSCPLSLQLALGGGAMYRFTDNYVTWVADAALRFGFKEGYKDHKFGWWSFSLGTRYYDGRFIPTASVSLMPVRALALAAMALEDDFPRIYTEIQAGHEFTSSQWMMGAQIDYIPGHLGIGTSFMIGFEGGWDVMAGPVFRLTPDYIPFDFQLYQGFGYGHFDHSGFMAETSLKFAFGHDLPYWGLWSFNVGCQYGSGNVAVTFGVSLPIISILGTAGMATLFYL